MPSARLVALALALSWLAVAAAAASAVHAAACGGRRAEAMDAGPAEAGCAGLGVWPAALLVAASAAGAAGTHARKPAVPTVLGAIAFTATVLGFTFGWGGLAAGALLLAGGLTLWNGTRQERAAPPPGDV